MISPALHGVEVARGDRACNSVQAIAEVRAVGRFYVKGGGELAARGRAVSRALYVDSA